MGTSAPDRLSTLFDVLSHPYRRIVFYFLSEHETASLETLAACVAGWVQSGPGVARSPAGFDYETIRLQLHHVHLPAIADAGFASYDDENREMTLGELPDVAEPLLAAAVDADAGAADSLDVDALVADFEEGDG